MHYKLEICANSIESALAAAEGGADRIELCDNMEEGGTTPSFGTIKRCLGLLHIPVFPIIRPRGGGFVYTNEEFEVMKEDIKACKTLGCQGVVIGILKPDGGVDMERNQELIGLARPMEVTFHRAFDCCNDLKTGLEDIISLGCERVLTSGGKPVAYEGADMIKELVEQAAGRIRVMAGAGVNEENVTDILTRTGVFEIHTTAKVKISTLPAGIDPIVPSAVIQTSTSKVNQIKNLILSFKKPF